MKRTKEITKPTRRDFRLAAEKITENTISRVIDGVTLNGSWFVEDGMVFVETAWGKSGYRLEPDSAVDELTGGSGVDPHRRVSNTPSQQLSHVPHSGWAEGWAALAHRCGLKTSPFATELKFTRELELLSEASGTLGVAGKRNNADRDFGR